MRRLFFASAALLASGSAGALDLLCDATLPAPSAEQRLSITIRIDQRTGESELFTPGGMARGTLQETKEDFKGEVVDSSGLRSWLYVNRYEGNFVLAPIPTTDGAKARMWGNCAPAVQRF